MEGPLPNSKAFEQAHVEALKGNKGLCGIVTGLQPCRVGRHISKEGHNIILLIILPFLGTLSLVLIFLGIFYIFLWKLKHPHTDQTHNMDEEKVFSISTFDGGAMYKEIVEVT